MTESFSRAVQEVSKLPPEAQDFLAGVLFSEMESERKWDELFSRPESHELLKKMGREALEELRTGRTRELHIDEL
jgi:hypothetical protein